MFSKLFNFITLHKFISGIIILAIVLGGYFGFKNRNNNDNAVRYVTAAVAKGTLIVSVSGSGQVSALEQVDIKSKVKSDVVAVYVNKGDEVKAGKLIAKLNDQDFKKAIEDAEISLESAKLELEKLLTPDELTLLKAENALSQATESKQKTEDNIEKAYEDAFGSVTSAFLDLPTIMTGAMNVLYGYDIAKSETIISDYDWNKAVYQNSFSSIDRGTLTLFIESAESDYKIAKENYDKNLENYKNADRYLKKDEVESLLDETIETTKSIAQAIKSEINLLDFVVDYLSSRDRRIYTKITTFQSDLKSYLSKTNSLSSSLISIERSLQDNRETLVNAERTIEEKELSLAETKAGPTELEIRTKQSTIKQKENTLLLAKQDLVDCHIYIPFDGIITEVKIKKGDSVSAGTALANIITQQKIVQISFNEIDAANIKAGQKTTLTFDALPDVTISGKVIEVDTIGTVTQGVVSYGVKIAFDTEVEAVKPGMSVTADIITEAKQDVLVLPNSAIKSQGESYYVELVETSEEMRQQLLANVSGTILPTPPKLQPVETGLSNDLSVEVISGLKEGDIVVISTISPSTNQATQTGTTQTQGLQIPGINTGGGTQIQMRSFR